MTDYSIRDRLIKNKSERFYNPSSVISAAVGLTEDQISRVDIHEFPIGSQGLEIATPTNKSYIVEAAQIDNFCYGVELFIEFRRSADECLNLCKSEALPLLVDLGEHYGRQYMPLPQSQQIKDEIVDGLTYKKNAPASPGRLTVKTLQQWLNSNASKL